MQPVGCYKLNLSQDTFHAWEILSHYIHRASDSRRSLFPKSYNDIRLSDLFLMPRETQRFSNDADGKLVNCIIQASLRVFI